MEMSDAGCSKLINRVRFSIHSNRNLCWRTLLHALFLLHHGWVLVYTVQIPIENHENPVFRNMYTYKVAFLTGWNMMFQGIFINLSLTNDIMEWQDKHLSRSGEKIRYWRDVLYGGLVVPFTLFVTGIFWGVYCIDRELIFPKFYEEVIPWWLSFCVHTNISLVLVAETLLQDRRQPANRSLEIFLCFFFAIGYAVVIYLIYLLSGTWLYELFKAMSFWHICLYQLGCWVSSYVFYEMQFPINRYFHPVKRISEQEITQKNE
ncbi:androgen-dependent TFPI-regulating protein-like [Aricia agestis]|uniref:androgen-dependent TFPI-regulating protein-like n=1 Tax=Aricia agestis TaxID=91739 RepID=UPI001C2044A1|nr:androgen-dependent TFPI-regulating protein-like [Aricia agestis]